MRRISMTTGTISQAPEYLTSGDVARRYGVTLATVNRWMTVGVCVSGGGRAWLRHEKIGGYRKTTWQWVQEFRLACEGTGEPVSETSPAQVNRQAVADQERLAARLKPRGKK